MHKLHGGLKKKISFIFFNKVLFFYKVTFLQNDLQYLHYLFKKSNAKKLLTLLLCCLSPHMGLLAGSHPRGPGERSCIRTLRPVM